MITERDRAIFEAGIKLGALYHQWVGTPISKKSAETIESAIEKAVIPVRLDRTLMTQNIFGYSELSGLMFDVEIVTRVGFTYCRARLAPENGYPLMQVVECYAITEISRH
jgi:hypothetical protein